MPNRSRPQSIEYKVDQILRRVGERPESQSFETGTTRELAAARHARTIRKLDTVLAVLRKSRLIGMRQTRKDEL